MSCETFLVGKAGLQMSPSDTVNRCPASDPPREFRTRLSLIPSRGWQSHVVGAAFSITPPWMESVINSQVQVGKSRDGYAS